ncbi:hypothetical protein FGB62_48g116 [Gracilaria domingensis]|nr:hypothetical protein FGB62_48g116 [Gracilaria domingensis]
MDKLKGVLRWFVPRVQRAEDGREQWPSRLSFILASMGLAVGIGNLLRYPSIAYNNLGVQWFIPYVMALLFVGIPLLLLEISIGQAYRGGGVVAFNRVSHRLRGLGLSVVFVGYTIATYYVVILAWAMVFFRHSFTTPLPWSGGADQLEDFFFNKVIRNVNFTNASGDKGYGTSVIGETIGWTMLIWLLVYLSIFKGVSLTGRIVYFSMLFPLAMLLVITIRAVTLDNSWRGIRLYVATWNGSKLGDGQIWKDAVGQIFFSIGTGFGSFIAYASYNKKYANAVQDSFIIAFSNSIYEVIAGFAAFGVVGFLNLPTDKTLSTFTLAFLTYPQALAELPGSNVWSVLFFLTIVILGIDSAFGLLEGLVTVLADTDWGKRIPRWSLVFLVTLSAALLSIMYTTQFGLDLLDAVDKWFNELALILSMWVQCVGVTTLYRYKDVVSQTGFLAFAVANGAYLLSMVLLVLLGHLVNSWAGVIVFVAVLVGGTLTGVILSEDPSIPSPWAKYKYSDRLWWLSCYSGEQLRKDLNFIVGKGRNWKIPALWSPMLRWLTAPVLIVILSYAYRDFVSGTDAVAPRSEDPLHIYGFVVAHLVAVFLISSIVAPKVFDAFICGEKKEDHTLQYETGPGEVLGDTEPLPLETDKKVTN